MTDLKDVIQIDDRWYVLATSSHTDDRTRVLKHDELFGVFDRWGDIQHIGLGQQGIYFQGTRFLSRMELKINERRPLLLNSTIQEDNALAAVDLSLPDLYDEDRLIVRQSTVHMFRSKLLWQGQCHEILRLHNYGDNVAAFDMQLSFDADYADMFEVRGMQRAKRGELLSPRRHGEGLTLGYRGLDGRVRHTQIRFSESVHWRDDNTAVIRLRLPPGDAREISIIVACSLDESKIETAPYVEALRAHRGNLERRRAAQAEIVSSNEQFNDLLKRSAADLRMLTSTTDCGVYPYAGIPWFSTPFGRDALITAMQTLWLDPELTRGVLAFLALHQASELDPARDAEPGKILHEMRGGEMAALGEVPFACYYGTVDATPLFIWLAGLYYQRSGDIEFIRSIWPNICRALEWIDRYGDSDGDGFVEYTQHSPQGLVQHGWKDSDDSVYHADGRMAQGPIALCEVQAYVYKAKCEAAQLAWLFGDGHFAADLEDQARTLKQRFNETFWCEDIATYAIALDGEKRPCRVRSSNVGHVLAAEIADPALATRAAQTLLADSSFNGWGIRTIAAGEARYNPMSYHNGSIWPHDSAMVFAGLSRYGSKEEAFGIVTGLFEASAALDLHRLPELFCGFARQNGQGPTIYPVACVPQAWASGTVFHLLQSCLGLVFSPEKPQLRFHHPKLPEYLHRLHITNLRYGDGVIDLAFHRHPRDVGINVLRKQGDIEIAVIV